MIHYNAQGIAYADDDTPLADYPDVTKVAADTIAAALATRGLAPADIEAYVAGGWFTDTGWVNVPTAAGFGNNLTGLGVRRIGKRVQSRFGWNATGLALNTTATVVAIGGIPAGFRPPSGWYGWAGTSSHDRTGRVVVDANGSVFLIPAGAGVSSYFRMDAATWLVD